MDSVNTSTIEVVSYSPKEEKPIEFFETIDRPRVIVESKFNVYNGCRLVAVGDLIKHWDKEPESPIPANAKAIKILRVLNIEALSNGVNVEGVTVTISGEIVFE